MASLSMVQEVASLRGQSWCRGLKVQNRVPQSALLFY